MTISTLQKSINERLDEHYEEMVEIRRHLHKNPELSFQEEETAAFIASYYDTLQIPTRTKVGGHGVLAFIEGASPGPTIALRADFDALPIHDEKDVPYKSTKPGVMHACGHDGHTATLLVLAKVLHTHRDQLKGKIVLIHQHAEEYAPGGAKPMIEDGCLDGVDVIFGTHLWSSEPCGTILYKSGNFMAAADRFSIQVQGKGGHGAQPHLTKDAVLIGSQIVANLQQVVARKVNPIDSAVVSVGGFVAENAFNVIADSAVLTGTARSFEESARHIIEREIEQVVKGVCQMHDAAYTYEYVRGYPAVKNHPKPTEYIAGIANQTEGVTEVKEAETQMGGEDFAYYLQHVPGTFFYTGAMPENSQDVYPHHHPKFDINEKAMPIAAKVLANAVLSYNE
ncbi:M20 family metallopeptidase [Bacillus safensis]|uniref:M20 family metallopeptidase n=2 Tax=Bacillus safensis TaxID=561879 RepID=UPI0022383561|nr:M20 family metallopeptidase [Bacillus safensis]MCW4642850.1 M20 family metallopeptidase [Bacillus safensis]MCY7563875.1 M20 family metallopeptidase [Bacillus safensis]MCY7626358.1 M20 family metallopeptidase [Bacillus safensis]MCY7632490.1 M20 family metallopeptidase [Bacillus safensis]MCY7646902.1 M20 family metallopeptidase [Bacillus safensis]